MNTEQNQARYVPVADVARACGFSFMDLENRLRPDDWRSPRDFIHDGRHGTRYAVLSLFRLADHLQACGLADEAIALRAWAVKLPPPEPRFEDLRRVAVERVDASPAEMDAAAAHSGGGRRHASDKETLPNWAREWEGREE